MKNCLIISFFMLSLSNLAIAENKISAPKQSVECKQNVSEIFDENILKTIKGIYESATCSIAGEKLVESNLNYDYCVALKKCGDKIADETSTKSSFELFERDQDFIEDIVHDQIISDYASSEFDKYNSKDNQNYRRLLDVISKLPKEIQDQVVKCPTNRKFKNSCLEENVLSEQTQDVLDKLIMNRGQKLNSVEEQKKMSFSPTPEFILNAANNAELVNTIKSNLKNFNPVYDVFKKQEYKFRVGNTKDLVNYSFDRFSSLVVNKIKEKNLDLSKLSKDDSKQIFKEIILNLKSEEQDFILSFGNEKAKENIINAFSNLDLSNIDLNVSDEQNSKLLINKLDQLRIDVANNNMANSCSKINVEIEDVCEKVRDKMDKPDTLNYLNGNKKPLLKAIESYKANKTLDKDENERIARIISNNDFYENYFEVYHKLDSCIAKYSDDSLFSEMKGIADTNTKNAIRRRQGRHERVQKDIEQTGREVIDSYKKMSENSSQFRHEMKARGIAVNNSFEASVIKSKADDKHEIAVDKTDRITPAIDSNLANVGNSKNPVISNLPPISPNIPSGPNAVIDNAKKDNSDEDKKLKDKIADLEKKINAKAHPEIVDDKKGTKSNGSFSESDKEVNDLKRQVEELKALQRKNIEDREKVKAIANKSVTNPSVATRSVTPSITNYSDTTVTTTNKDNRDSLFIDKNKGIQSQNISNGPVASVQAVKGKYPQGITLNANGEVFQDPSSILKNPTEAEILNLFKVTDGKPFIISENGVYFKVSIKLDQNGKQVFVKEKLNDKQKANLLKVSSVKELKEVGREPTRLYNLNLILNEAKK